MTSNSAAIDTLKSLAYRMLTVRRVEERLLQLFSEGLLNGTVHTCIGQEACAVGTVSALDRERDVLFTGHRGHGHYLAYCDDVEGMIAEVTGRSTGACAGVGGSQHLHRRNFYSNGILGGTLPVATGIALAEKAKRTGAISVVFLGDGALAEGVVYESFNIAALWRLPVLFVVEHNGYAQSTPTRLEHAGDLETRGRSFGIETTSIEANDVLEVHQTAQSVVQAVRDHQVPHLLFLRTYRLAPHSKGDDHRDPAEIEHWRRRDPLLTARRQVGAEWWEEVDRQILDRIDRAVETAVRTSVARLDELEAGWRS